MLIALLIIGIIILTLVSFVLVCYVLNPFKLSQFNQTPSKYRHFHQSSRQSTNSSLNDDSTKYCSDDSAVVCNGSPASLRLQDEATNIDNVDGTEGVNVSVNAEHRVTAAVHQNGDAVHHKPHEEEEVHYVELISNDAPEVAKDQAV